MIIGSSDKFAFLIEKVSDWSSCGYTNGLMYLYLRGKKYPVEDRTVTLNMEINHITSNTSPLVNPTVNKTMFDMAAHQLFEKFCELTFEKGDYSYHLPFLELENAGYYVFAVSLSDMVRIQVGIYHNADFIEYADEVVVEKVYTEQIVDLLEKIKERL